MKTKQGETSSPLSWTMKRFLEPASRVKDQIQYKQAASSAEAAVDQGDQNETSALLQELHGSVCFLCHVFKFWC